RRSTTSSASEHSPAIAVRKAVSATGSMADTASRVAGSVPPKIAMPTKPSNRPRRWREEWEDMARLVIGFVLAGTATHSVHIAAMRALSRCNAAPHQAEPGKKQQAQHDVAEIPVAQPVVGPRAE